MSGVVKDKNQDPNEVITSYFRFRVKSPLNHFCEIFKKKIPQQWYIAKAHFMNLILQVLNLICLILTQKYITIRMEFEENEMRRTLSAIMIHVISWVYLCYLRRKKFSIPKVLGWLTFNIFSLTYLYLNSYMLTANTLGDPNSKIIYTYFMVSDSFFAFFYVLLNDYIHPSGYLGFTMFPKVFWVICFYYYFDNRLYEILAMYFFTSLLTGLTGLQSEELMVDVYDEEVGDDFNVIDYYTLTYLDVLYISKMCYYGICDIVNEYRYKWFGGENKEKEE